MSIQWTLVAGILYFEIFLVTILLLPFLKPRTWQKFFKSKFLRSVESQANLYFMVFIVILILLFLDSMREMTKYAGNLNTDQSGSRHVDAELQHSMKLFRAQRNFYIAGFALFLFLVIRRLVTLLTALAQLDIQAEAAIKQAKSASVTAEGLMKSEKAEKSGGDKANNKEISKLQDELAKAKANEEAMKKQASNLTEEYDRLMKEHQTLVKKQEKVEGKSKKDN